VGSFRDLLVYRRAVQFADEIHASAADWDSFDRWTVGVQLVRSADSIGANVAESSGRSGTPDQRRLFFIARGSAFETEHWLERAAERGLTGPANAAARAGELSRMLSGLVRRL
jgi:four helix bundle protein